MTAPDVVLIGYYGRGNFGDDVLMIVAHSIAREMLPNAKIAIRVGTAANYIANLLGANVHQIPFGTHGKHHLILHGGGGTFFDFTSHGLGARALNSALFTSGTQAFIQAEKALRSLLRKPRMSAHRRVGIGIGVGTFTAGSAKLRAALPILADFDALWLRDSESRHNLSQLGVGTKVVDGSDLAFLWESWCPPELVLKAPISRPGKPRVGIILRDWLNESGEMLSHTLIPVLDVLATRFDLHVIALDKATDTETLRALQHLPRTLWQPETMTITEIAEALADCDVLLTARAHGAICGACLGRPSVILQIEPKLATVHAMLPQATRLAAPDSTAATFAKLIDEALEIPLEIIAADAQANRHASALALAQIKLQALG